MHRVVFLTVFTSIVTSSPLASAAVPVEKMNAQMESILAPLGNAGGWNTFVTQHADCTGAVNEKSPVHVGVSDISVKIDGSDYKIGLGCRSVFVNAKPQAVVTTVNNPKLFQALYGLDKPADIYPLDNPASYKARIYKLVPGIETQDYTLDYSGHWEGPAWIQHAKLVKDERDFALRDNMKIVEPSEAGSVFREISLFVPRRWWMNLVHGLVQSVTKRELSKLNVAIKCAAEKAETGVALNDDIARACHREAEK